MSVDIEKLNKSQFILLVLLVSFVTSIATGIVTVSLMERAPKDVVRVVQKVVEKTVEKVDKIGPEKQNTKIIEKTIVVKDTDTLSQAIVSVRNKLLSLKDKKSGKMISFALPVADKEFVASGLSKDGSYLLVDRSGKEYEIKLLKYSPELKLYLFELASDGIKLKKIEPSDSNEKLGERVFVFTSYKMDKVSQSIISSISANTLEIDLDKGKILPGSVMFNLKGNFVAINKSDLSKASDIFIRSSKIVSFVKESPKQKEQSNKNEKNDNSSSSADTQASSKSVDAESQKANVGATLNEDIKKQNNTNN